MRVPAGVRVAGRSYGGRFVTMGQLRALVAATTDAGRVILFDAVAHELERNGRTVERLVRKFDDDPKRYAARLHDAETTLFAWQDMADKLVDRFTETRTGRIVTPPPPPPPPPPSEEYDEPLDDIAEEFEIGVEYFAAGGRASNVDINIRIRREDGGMMRASEARDVMAAMMTRFNRGEDDPTPRGYYVAGVDWKRPGKASRGWKHGDADDLENFKNVLYIAAGDNTARWRVGSVDE